MTLLTFVSLIFKFPYNSLVDVYVGFFQFGFRLSWFSLLLLYVFFFLLLFSLGKMLDGLALEKPTKIET